MTFPSNIWLPSGIVDPIEEIAYVVAKQGRIFCLALDTAEILASTDVASIPLTVAQGFLIGWSHAPQRSNEIRIFAASRRENVLAPQWEKALQLPEWVDLTSAEPDSFKLEAEIRPRCITVTWEAHARYHGGAPPSPEFENAARHDERHILELNREDGATIGHERIEPEPSQAPTLPKLRPETQIVPYRRGTAFATQSWRAATVNACLIKRADDPGIVLWIQEKGGADSEIRLSDNPKAAATITLDGKLIFIQEPRATDTAWQVFSTTTGERIASLPFDPGTAGLSVVKDLVLYEVRVDAAGLSRRTLRCRNLRNGKALWSFVLAEEAMRTPPPPPR